MEYVCKLDGTLALSSMGPVIYVKRGQRVTINDLNHAEFLIHCDKISRPRGPKPKSDSGNDTNEILNIESPKGKKQKSDSKNQANVK